MLAGATANIERGDPDMNWPFAGLFGYTVSCRDRIKTI
jgi:hypothetical protein